MNFFTPEEARYREAGDPSPPAPMISTRPCEIHFLAFDSDLFQEFVTRVSVFLHDAHPFKTKIRSQDSKYPRANLVSPCAQIYSSTIDQKFSGTITTTSEANMNIRTLGVICGVLSGFFWGTMDIAAQYLLHTVRMRPRNSFL